MLARNDRDHDQMPRHTRDITHLVSLHPAYGRKFLAAEG